MRKFLAILAFCCLLFIVGGYSLLYQIRLNEIKADVKKELLRAQKSQLTELVFTDAEFALLEHEDEGEFRYADTMYDVVKIENKDGQVYCWCLPDKKETALVDHYLKTQNPSEKSPSQSLLKLLKAPFLAVTFSTPEVSCQNSATLFRDYASLLSALCRNTLAPPPRFC